LPDQQAALMKKSFPSLKKEENKGNLFFHSILMATAKKAKKPAAKKPAAKKPAAKKTSKKK